MKFLKYITFIFALGLIPVQSGSMLLGNYQEPFRLDLRLKQDPGRSNKIHRYFNRMVRSGFNGSMLVTHKGNIIYKNAHGIKNAITRDSLTVQTPFQLASISKQFTAAAIMKLQEWGILNYDDKVAAHLPGFPYPEITIRQLLVHRSGLMEYTYFMDKHIADKSTYITNADVLAKINKHAPAPYFKPDTHFDYRNTNYVLLASIVEHVSGMSFPDFLHAHFFAPLEMDNSFVMNGKNNKQAQANATTGYYYKWRSFRKFFLDGVYGDKGVFSSVEDLFKWDRALYTNKILKQSTLQEAFKPGSPDRRGNRNYGFGWRMREYSGKDTIYYHPGWWRGYKTLYVRIPETQSAIFILTNELYYRFMSTYPYLIRLLNEETEAETDVAPKHIG